jgi:hypothetical protein
MHVKNEVAVSTPFWSSIQEPLSRMFVTVKSRTLFLTNVVRSTNFSTRSDIFTVEPIDQSPCSLIARWSKGSTIGTNLFLVLAPNVRLQRCRQHNKGRDKKNDKGSKIELHVKYSVEWLSSVYFSYSFSFSFWGTFLASVTGHLNREPARLLLIPLNHFKFNTAKKSCGKLYLCYKAHHLRSQRNNAWCMIIYTWLYIWCVFSVERTFAARQKNVLLASHRDISQQSADLFVKTLMISNKQRGRLVLNRPVRVACPAIVEAFTRSTVHDDSFPDE